jgi:hypothetical protein
MNKEGERGFNHEIHEAHERRPCIFIRKRRIAGEKA